MHRGAQRLQFWQKNLVEFVCMQPGQTVVSELVFAPERQCGMKGFSGKENWWMEEVAAASRKPRGGGGGLGLARMLEASQRAPWEPVA